ncbi:MAG: glycosyltransferase family 9 protein [Acidimicrobiales bacterium]
MPVLSGRGAARATGPPLLVALRPLGLGDLLTAVPALRALTDAFPDHRRVLAAPTVLEPLALASGAVDAVVHTMPLRPLGPELAQADVAVDLHGRGPASHRVLLASRPRRLVAFANPEVASTSGYPEWHDGEHEVARWCRMLTESGIPADPCRLDLPAPTVEPPWAAVGATVVHPGAAYPARRWPPARWAAVARHVAAEGRRVLITGGPAEIEPAAAVAAVAGLAPEAVLAGRTDLIQLSAVVAGAERVVCGDTGIAHLATAMGTPSVVLFGPEPPSRWGPPPDRPWHRALWASRRGDPHGAHLDPGLARITVDEVLEALAGLPLLADHVALQRGGAC